MLRQFVVLFLIPLELFPLPAADGTKDLLFTSLIVIVTLQHTHILSVVDQLGIGRIDMALTKREIMNGIQQIGLPHSVIPEKTIYIGRERNFCLKNVFIIEYRKLFKYHPYYISRTKLKNILLSIDFLSKKNYFCDLNCHRHKNSDKIITTIKHYGY
ncbi:unknown [Parabacteroides johnsonii CAG:246]|nr:unknown [Parabacteroides johnsonii CAG:246]